VLGFEERFGKDCRSRGAGHRGVDGAAAVSGGGVRDRSLRGEKIAMRAVERAAKGVGDIEHGTTIAGARYGKACAALPKYVGP